MQSTSFELKTTIVKAGAGAGKTTELVALFVEYVENYYRTHKRWPRIVVTTFTRKATQELKERLLHKALSLQEEFPEKSDFYEALFHYISKKSFVQISTIHGTLSLFLKRVGSAMELSPDFKILSEAELRKMRKRLLRELILESEEFQDLIEVYEFQQIEEALKIYFQRWIEYPHLQPITSQELLQMVETASREMQMQGVDICQSILESTDNEKWQTYIQMILNSLQLPSSNILNYFIGLSEALEPRKPPFSSKKEPFESSLDEAFTKWRDQSKDLLDALISQMVSLEDHEKACKLFARLADLFCKKMWEKKIHQGALGMSDLELVALKAVEAYPQISASFSREWDFWMVDEYQDTSPLQVRVLRALVGQQPCYYVGDPQQSIYLFRGARSEVFFEKIQEVQKSGGTFREKLTNYRSSPSVLGFVNELFSRIDAKRFSRMEAGRAEDVANEPAVQIWLEPPLQEKNPVDRGFNEVATAARVIELLRSGVTEEEICVLCRSHRDLELVARSLMSAGVEVQVHGSGGFFERLEIKDALAVLRFLVNPHDNINLVALLRSPWFFVSDATLAEWTSSNQISLWNTLNSNFRDHQIVSLLRAYLECSSETGIIWTLQQILVERGFFLYCHKLDNSGRREANLWKLLSVLHAEERNAGFQALEFIEKALGGAAGDVENEDGDATPVIEPRRVNLMTIHASKGLQFDHIILSFMNKRQRTTSASFFMCNEEDGRWTLQVKDNETGKSLSSLQAVRIRDRIVMREKEESWRLLYVALTRAKKGITLIWKQKVESDSWVKDWPLPVTEGLHSLGTANYLVRFTEPKYNNMVFAKDIELKVRPQWISTASSLASEGTSSITEILEENRSSGGQKKDVLAGLQRAQFGTRAHRVFEGLKYFSLERLLANAKEQDQRAIQFIVGNSDVPLKKLIAEGFPEYGFVVKDGDQIYQGQIDLWGRVSNQIYLIDYKTGSPDFAEKAFLQLSFYAWALYRMKELKEEESIILAVVYPFQEVVSQRKLTVKEVLAAFEALNKNP